MGAHGHRGHRLGHDPPLRGQRRHRLRHPRPDRAGPADGRLRPLRAALASGAAAALLALAGCGDPAELSETDAETLQSARERLDDAIETAEIVRTDKGEARRLLRQVQRNSREPARLKLLVPSLVTVTGNVYPPAYRSFVQNATTNATRALYPPAAREVERMVTSVDEADAKSKIATLNGQTADAYLAEATRDTQPIWPELARVLKQSREEL